jgi:tape measure domain-containing protein|tara:strand:- start:236 stop:2395 length:2160 start_codon:yes stop_codon:yes gene_type:complete
MVVRVGIEFQTSQAAAATKRLQADLAKLHREIKRLRPEARQSLSAIEQLATKGAVRINELNENTKRLNRSMKGLGSVLRGVSIGFAAVNTAQAGIARDESERRLRLLTQAFGETEQAQEAARRAADRFNLSQTEANVQLSRLIARLRPMGLSMQTIETAFAGFNTATILAGATASESAGAFLQLSQALGSGVLRGQELNSILEQAPLIAQAIATEMGATVGALKKFGEEGQITSEIVIAALQRVEREGAGQLEEALKGPAAAIKDFQNATEDVQVALTEAIIPEMARSFRELADLLRTLGPLIKVIGGDIGGGLGAINDLISINTETAADAAREILERGRIVPGERGLEELFEPIGGAAFVNKMRQQAANVAKVTGEEFRTVFVERLQQGLKTLDVKAANLPANFMDMVDRAPGRFKVKDKPSKEELRRLKIMQRQQEIAEKRLMMSEGELAILKESSDLSKIDLKFDLKRQALQQEYGSLISKALSDEVKTNLEKALANKLDALRIERNEAISGHMRDQFDALSQVTAEMQEMAPFAKQLSQEFQSLANTINNEILSGIEGMIDGTKTLGQVASDVLKQVARQMFQTAIMAPSGSGGIGGMILSALGLGGGGGGFQSPAVLTSGLDFSGAFASGGRPPVGKAALVGERGPELFVPSTSGTIVPNGQLGGATNVVVNVDAKGTSASGDNGSAKQLGGLIGAAVQAELVKQQRPGGLLAR